jgi:outer membrane protein TolC
MATFQRKCSARPIIGLVLLLGSSFVLGAKNPDEAATGQGVDNQISEQEGQATTRAEERAAEAAPEAKPPPPESVGPEPSSSEEDQLEAQAQQGSAGAKKLLKAKSQAPAAPVPGDSAAQASAAPAPQAAAPDQVHLQKITVKERDNGVKVYIALSAPTPFFSFFQKNPPSVFVQFLSSAVTASGGPVDNVGLGPIDQVAYGYDTLAMQAPGHEAPLRHLEFRLNKSVAHYAEQDGPLITLSLVEAGPAETAPGASSFESSQYKGGMTLPDRPTLDDFLSVARGNNRNIALAKEGLALAQSQVFEAARPLFPSATLRASRTTGDDANPFTSGTTGTFLTTGYQRNEYGVQLGQPVFESGRMWAAYQRSKLNRDAAQELVRKQTGDVDFEAQRAYDDVLKTQAELRLRRELLAQATQIRDLTLKKKALKLTSQIDALNVEAQFDQAAYQAASNEQEAALARLSLAAVLNQPRPLPDVVPGNLSPRRVQVNLETLLGWAAANRADLKLARMNVDLAEKSWKIARGEDGFRVDMSGFLGQAGAAFSDEPLVMSTAWNVGVKASVPFWGNTLSGSRTDEKTAPDLSQAFVTTVHSNSVALGILDALPGRSKAEQARLNYEKSKADCTETFQKAEYEVRDAYFNLVKLSHQLDSAQRDMEFRKKQLAVTRERNNLGLVENSQLLTDVMGAVQAEISFQEAMAASETGMAALDKAIGMKLAR